MYGWCKLLMAFYLHCDHFTHVKSKVHADERWMEAEALNAELRIIQTMHGILIEVPLVPRKWKQSFASLVVVSAAATDNDEDGCRGKERRSQQDKNHFDGYINYKKKQ